MQLLSCKADCLPPISLRGRGGRKESQTWSRDLGAKQLEGEEEEERKRRKEQGEALFLPSDTRAFNAFNLTLHLHQSFPSL